MEDFPLADADSGMTTLVGLITVMAAKILHGTVIGDGYFIYRK